MKKYKKKGMSLIEIIFTITIGFLVLLVINDFIAKGFKSITISSEKEDAIEHARKALESMTKELRGANSSEKGDYPISTIQEQNFIYYTDIDRDGQTEKIRYYLDKEDNKLKMIIYEPGDLNDYNTTGQTSILAEYVNNNNEKIFSYYDSNGNETDEINKIGLIKILLKINITPTRLPDDYEIETDVQFRNLKDKI
ncbi:MAG: hypothetical protein PHZ07_05190 [Patescibacteria group bacterium]|nr:hypothetical protein [Patescibacteria group bacterium]MDD4304805.1 hypothetical protein [Patescibacteria group bacterium]MDD4695865.1 hypothetical protein [Patescibacteria group bacterium]